MRTDGFLLVVLLVVIAVVSPFMPGAVTVNLYTPAGNSVNNELPVCYPDSSDRVVEPDSC